MFDSQPKIKFIFVEIKTETTFFRNNILHQINGSTLITKKCEQFFGPLPSTFHILAWQKDQKSTNPSEALLIT